MSCKSLASFPCDSCFLNGFLSVLVSCRSSYSPQLSVFDAVSSARLFWLLPLLRWANRRDASMLLTSVLVALCSHAVWLLQTLADLCFDGLNLVVFFRFSFRVPHFILLLSCLERNQNANISIPLSLEHAQ